METCKKCGGQCKPSKAIQNKIVSNQFIQNFTLTVIEDVMKCNSCGHSFIPEQDIYEEYENLVQNRGNIVWTPKP